MEFNFIEICMSYAYYNSATAADLNCQNDLIDVMAKLMAGECDTSIDFFLPLLVKFQTAIKPSNTQAQNYFHSLFKCISS